MLSKETQNTHKKLTTKKRSRHDRYIKSIVYGGLDGAVTTFVIVAGATGADLSPGILLILGIGSLVGDAFSMGIGDYVSSSSEAEYHDAERRHHEHLFDVNLHGEKEKIKASYRKKGLNEQDAEKVTELLTKNKRVATEIMMLNEHGIVETNTNPAHKGLYTFCSFLFFGFVPLLTYLVAPHITFISCDPFITASLLTSITLFTLGALKVRITQRHWFFSGVQMLCIGGLSASIAYVIGRLLSGLA